MRAGSRRSLRAATVSETGPLTGSSGAVVGGWTTGARSPQPAAASRATRPASRLQAPWRDIVVQAIGSRLLQREPPAPQPAQPARPAGARLPVGALLVEQPPELGAGAQRRVTRGEVDRSAAGADGARHRHASILRARGPSGWETVAKSRTVRPAGSASRRARRTRSARSRARRTAPRS